MIIIEISVVVGVRDTNSLASGENMICHREPEYNTHALARIHKKEHNAHAMFSKIELTFSMDQFILHALKTHITQTPNK